MIDKTLLIVIFFLPFVVVSIFLFRATLTYFVLYRKKKNPKYPVAPNDIQNYLSKDPVQLFKLLPITPFFMWKIIFEKHKDKELNDAAKRVRFFLFLAIGTLVFQFFFPLSI